MSRHAIKQRIARRAFTLIELLAVISIIAIVLGIALSAITTVRRHAKKTVAIVEAKELSNAWMRYLDYYGRWPTNSASISAKIDSNVYYDTYRIDEEIMAALEGVCTNDVARSINPDSIKFMEFGRKGMSQDKTLVPVSPWYGQYPIGEGTLDDPGCYYFVRFDINANNSIDISDLRDRSDYEMKTMTSPVSRSVIVWTMAPRDASGKKEAICSWQQ